MSTYSFRINRMINLMVMAVLALSWLVGCAHTDMQAERQYGYNPPVIEATYAPQSISTGDYWYIYLNGYDPDGDMRFINVWLDTPCLPDTPNRLRIDPEQRQDISGYLSLYLYQFAGVHSDIFGGWLRLRILLEDMAGNQSQAVELSPMIYHGGSTSDNPPEGVFADRFLGKIPARYNAFEPCAGTGGGADVP